MNHILLKEDLSPIATSGSYEDLENKPSIPSKTSELQNDSEFIDKTTLGDIANLDSDLKTQLIGDNKNIDFLNALNQAFQSGVSVKQSAVTALIAKGATGVTADSPWTDIINAIGSLTGTPGSPGTLKQITKLNIVAPDIKTVTLDSAVDEKLQLATSMLLFVPGSMGVVEHKCGFDNSDASNFNYNPDYITFDSKMRPINQYLLTWDDVGVLEGYGCYEVEVDESLYKAVDGFIDNEANLTIGAIPPDQVITGKSDMSIAGIEQLKSISENSQGFRFALSFDGGVTYNTWDGSSWIIVDINDSIDIKAKFMTKTILDSLTEVQLETLRNGSSILRIAYLSEQTTSSDSCYTDQLDITVDLLGYDTLAPQANWSYRLLDDKRTLEYTFTVSGTYTINYV